MNDLYFSPIGDKFYNKKANVSAKSSGSVFTKVSLYSELQAVNWKVKFFAFATISWAYNFVLQCKLNTEP